MSSSRLSASSGKITGALSCIRKISHSLVVFVLTKEFPRTLRIPLSGTKFQTFPVLICSNIFGGSLPINGNVRGIGAPVGSALILSILRESTASTRT